MKVLNLLIILNVCLCSVGASRISHVIVLMMENRSFDHILGWLKAALSPKVDGISEGSSVPRDPNDPSQGSVPITRNGYDVSPDDPRHDFDSIANQINSNSMDGFVLDAIQNGNNETNPVSMFDEKSAPILNSLALEFAVFDKWFCSIPGPTDPNRAFAMAGTSKGVLTNFNGTLWEQQSYFDYLREHNRTFAGYYQDDLWALGYFEDMHQPENSKNIFELEPNFYNDVASGNLADFTWLQPRMTTVSPESLPTWQHPDASIREGERLIKEIYEAIRQGPKWEETLFLITYDEHGGFYDHVPPPDDGVPSPDGIPASNGFNFDQLGVRIPTVAISPWIPAGTIVSESFSAEEQPTPTSAFDSTSILATTNILLGLDKEGAAPLGERMSWANTFAGLTDILPAARQDCPTTLPDVPAAPADAWLKQRALPLNHHLEAQLLFYCTQHYSELQRKGECPGRAEVLHNQGLASDWIVREAKRFRASLAEKEARAH